jgi:hypothetical protein
MALSNRQAEGISGGIFLIGLGLMFANVIPWWPGIMFVLGGASIAHGLVEGRGRYAFQGGVWMIGIGLLFLKGFNLPLLFILIGISMLLGTVFGPPFISRDKQKNKDLLAGDEHDPTTDEYELGDDGELIKVKNEAKLVEEKGSHV